MNSKIGTLHIGICSDEICTTSVISRLNLVLSLLFFAHISGPSGFFLSFFDKETDKNDDDDREWKDLPRAAVQCLYFFFFEAVFIDEAKMYTHT